jgi:3,4-dihydroxy 2-butanone 4-phosphate synthase/GTP cyclohydrolase II
MDLIEGLMAGAAERAAALRRPLVTITYAQSLDGALSTRNGAGMAISCPETKLLTHRLRAANLGILVGIGTVLADDPSLNARLAGGPHPQPVVLDRLLRIPLEARLVKCQDLSPWVFCGPDASLERQKSLEQRGVLVLRVGTGANNELNLDEVLTCLGNLHLTSLMVEGGAKVLTSFLKMRLADQAMLTIAPVWVGGLPSIDSALDRRMAYPALCDPQYTVVGRDMVVWGKIGEEIYATTGPVFYAAPAG